MHYYRVGNKGSMTVNIGNKYIVFSCMFPFIIFSAPGAGGISGWGKINMQGAIIDTACSISTDSREQTVDMDNIPLSSIIRDGQGNDKSFSIELVNCVLERKGNNKWKQFQVTFDGEADGQLFGVHGQASGVALQIVDQRGNIAFPGKALPLADFMPGNGLLDYTLKLVANSHALKSGDYFTSIRFKLDYF